MSTDSPRQRCRWFVRRLPLLSGGELAGTERPQGRAAPDRLPRLSPPARRLGRCLTCCTSPRPSRPAAGRVRVRVRSRGFIPAPLAGCAPAADPRGAARPPGGGVGPRLVGRRAGRLVPVRGRVAVAAAAAVADPVVAGDVARAWRSWSRGASICGRSGGLPPCSKPVARAGGPVPRFGPVPAALRPRAVLGRSWSRRPRRPHRPSGRPGPRRSITTSIPGSRWAPTPAPATPRRRTERRFAGDRPCCEDLGGESLADVRCQMADVRWQMADGKCQMANARWQIADARWQIADAR